MYLIRSEAELQSLKRLIMEVYTLEAETKERIDALNKFIETASEPEIPFYLIRRLGDRFTISDKGVYEAYGRKSNITDSDIAHLFVLCAEARFSDSLPKQLRDKEKGLFTEDEFKIVALFIVANYEFKKEVKKNGKVFYHFNLPGIFKEYLEVSYITEDYSQFNCWYIYKKTKVILIQLLLFFCIPKTTINNSTMENIKIGVLLL